MQSGLSLIFETKSVEVWTSAKGELQAGAQIESPNFIIVCEQQKLK